LWGWGSTFVRVYQRGEGDTDREDGTDWEWGAGVDKPEQTCSPIPTIGSPSGPNPRTAWPAAPKGNKNALKHGVYAADPDPPDPDDVGAIIARQKARLRQLERYIDDRFPELTPDRADDEVGEALEIVSQVLGIDLTGQP